MKRTVVALAFVAVACARQPSSPSGAPPSQPPQPVAVAKASGDASGQPAPPPPNEVVKRIIQGGQVFARLASSCETLVVAAGKTPEQRALEIDTSESLGCWAKRKAGILFDVTDPQRIRCTGWRQQTGRAILVAACPLGERGVETETPRTNEAIIGGVRLFADRAACDATAAAVTMAHEPTCFEDALVKAVDQRKDDLPKGDFVTRFESFINDPSATAWQRSGEPGRICEPWRIQRSDKDFTFFREWVEKKTTKVRREAGFSYDATCKRVTANGRSTTWTEPNGGGRGSSGGGGWTMPLEPDDKQPDALPLYESDWFYTRRACERSPR